MKSYMQIAIRYMKCRKKRTALVVMSIALTSMLIYVAVTLLVNTRNQAYKESLAMGNYHLVIYNTSALQNDMLVRHAMVDECIRVSLEHDVFLYGSSYPVSNWYTFADMNQSMFPFKLLTGRMPQNPNEVVVSETVARSFAKHKRIGDIISTSHMEQQEGGGYSYVNVVDNSYTICGILKGEAREGRDSSFAVTLPDSGTPLSSYIRFSEPFDWTQPLNFMQWEEKAKMLHDAAGISYHPVSNLNRSYRLNYDLAQHFMQQEDSLLIAVALLMIAVLLIYLLSGIVRGMFSANLYDKLQDFCILKGMGASDGQVRRIFFRECMLEGLLGFALAVIGGNLIIYLVFCMGLSLTNLPLRFNLSAVLLAAVFVFFTMLFALNEPFGRLKRVAIVDGMNRNVDVAVRKLRSHRGRPFRIFGVEGAYAYKNIRRNSKTFWTSVASFTVSVLIFTVLSFAMVNLRLLDESGDPELLTRDTDNICEVSVHWDNGMNMMVSETASFREELKQLPYVQDIYPYACREAWFMVDADGMLTKTDAQAMSKIDNFLPSLLYVEFLNRQELALLEEYIDGGQDTIDALQSGGLILVDSVYRNFGNGRERIKWSDYQVGDSVKWHIPEVYGDGLKNGTDLSYMEENEKNLFESFEIKGFSDRSFYEEALQPPKGPIAIMSSEYMESRIGSEAMNLLCDRLLVQTDSAHFDRREFSQIVKDYDYTWSYTNLDALLKARTNTAGVVAAFLIVFILSLGLISIINNMVNEQIARKREIALLRAVGMSKNSLNKMLTMEKFIIGILAWLFGSLFGFFLSYLYLWISVEAFDREFVMPWSAVLLSGGVLLLLMYALSHIMVRSLGEDDIAEHIRCND